MGGVNLAGGDMSHCTTVQGHTQSCDPFRKSIYSNKDGGFAKVSALLQSAVSMLKWDVESSIKTFVHQATPDR